VLLDAARDDRADRIRRFFLFHISVLPSTFLVKVQAVALGVGFWHSRQAGQEAFGTRQKRNKIAPI